MRGEEEMSESPVRVKCSRCHSAEAIVLIIELTDSDPGTAWGHKVGDCKAYCGSCLQNDYG
jgi:hypothetical protein